MKAWKYLKSHGNGSEKSHHKMTFLSSCSIINSRGWNILHKSFLWDQTPRVSSLVALPSIHGISHSASHFLCFFHPRPSSPSSCLLVSVIKWQKKKQNKVARRCLLTSHLYTSLSLSLVVSFYPQFPEPRESGLGETGGLSEDDSGCLGASPWALVGSLASALLLAQHAL